MLYEKCQLSKEQVGFFHHNGYLVADGLYTEEQIDQLEQAYEVSIPGRMRDFTHGDWKKMIQMSLPYTACMMFNAFTPTGLDTCLITSH